MAVGLVDDENLLYSRMGLVGERKDDPVKALSMGGERKMEDGWLIKEAEKFNHDERQEALGGNQ
jgi:hypothetical protein